MKIRLACLDMAGTTVGDDGMVERAFLEAIDQVGVEDVEAAKRFVLETMGRSKIEVFKELLGGDEPKARRANEAFESAYEAACERGEASALPGAVEAIGRLRDAGVKVCLTTGFSASTQSKLIAALGWEDVADLALTPAEGRRGRPWPDMIFDAFKHFRLDDVREIAVAGDTTSDLMAGGRSGASIVAGVLTGAHSRDELAAAPHTHIIESVAELPDLIL